MEDGTNTVAEYQYDGRRFRTVKTVFVDGEFDHTRYFYHTSQWQVLEERLDTSTAAAEQYVWGLRYIDDLILRDRDADSDFQTGELRHDQLFRPGRTPLRPPRPELKRRRPRRQRRDGEGTVRLPPYGSVTVYNADWSVTRSYSFEDNRYFYTGRILDIEAGLYFYRCGYYHAMLGTFVARDPIRYEESEWNLYEYVQSVPTTSVDPSGLAMSHIGHGYDRCGGVLYNRASHGCCGSKIYPLYGSGKNWCCYKGGVVAECPPEEITWQDCIGPPFEKNDKICGYSVWLLTGSVAYAPRSRLGRPTDSRDL